MKHLLFGFCILLALATKGFCYELGIVTMFRNEAPYIREWIEYHRIVGVDHFWLYNNASTDNSLEILQPYVDSGLVEVFPWDMHLDERQCRINYTGNQIRTIMQGLSLAKGNCKWVAIIDMDEFLLPMREKNIPESLNKYFADASAISLNWRMFGTNNVFVPLGEPFLAKLTACAEIPHPENSIGKSIVRPEQVRINDIWYPHHFPLVQGAKYYDGDHNVLESYERFDRENKAHTEYRRNINYSEKFIRINHYHLRDENFYRTRRLAYAQKGLLPKSLERLLEHYDSFGKTQDRFIIDFLKKNYPEEYKRIWAKYE